MNEEHRKELWKLFENVGRTEAINKFHISHDYTKQYVMRELDNMIDDAYDMAYNCGR